ncbi:MAG: putative transposase [Spirosomataceae bacterium]|jgi:putative transposase
MDGFDDVWLGKREIVETKLKYIHDNPMQPHWAMADKPTDYPYSSAGFDYSERKSDVNLTHYLECF